MLLSGIWTVMLLLSLACGLGCGNAAAVGAAALEGANAAVELLLTLAGPLLFWSGLQELLARSGVAGALGRRLSPLLGRLFPSCREDEELSAALGANLSANLLGLGNAATPAGIRAASLLQARGGPDRGELCRLVVMNTASLQLIPATVGAVRQSLGAASPFDILPAVWAVSLLSVTAGLLAEGLLRP